MHARAAIIEFVECEHTRKYASPFPNTGETLYCLKCRQWRTVGPYEETDGWNGQTGWRWRRIRKRFKAECLVCEWKALAYNWYALRERADHHFWEKHCTKMKYRSEPLP